MPYQVLPMLAVLSDLPDKPDEWGVEYKWDGIRVICYWDSHRLKLESRNQREMTARYPEFRDLGKNFGECRVILDGEIVALDEKGRPDFSRLQRRMHVTPSQALIVAPKYPVSLFFFDVLYLNDRSTMEYPYSERREMLEGLNLQHPSCRIPPSYPGEGTAMLEVARELGLEGILAKRLTSPYQPGIRSANWRKIKLVTKQEFVIGGWTEEQHNANRIGALLLGYYDEDGLLHYAGRVGSGFSNEDHRLLLATLRPLERRVSPFTGPVPAGHFVAPRLVVDVEYRRWFPGGLLQQTSFKGLRTDKPATDVIREVKE